MNALRVAKKTEFMADYLIANKAGYTATYVAREWAGPVMANQTFGPKQKC